MFRPTRGLFNKYYALMYDYVPDVLEKRAPHRKNHFNYLQKYESAGQLILGGAFNPPSLGACLIFKGEKEMVEEFAKSDPYILNKVVIGYKVIEWTAVAGCQLDEKHRVKL
jgi:uncharacterized protein YciI